MTFRDARMLSKYWQDSPPEHELAALFARVQFGWKPLSERSLTPEQIRDEHQKSLEARWANGAMNPKQMFEAMGGAISLNGTPGQKLTGANLPGIGPFPGAN
jgi:hypothetical protein